jgi:hypothetical protein
MWSLLSEGKRHVDSEDDDDDVPIACQLSQPPKTIPELEIPKGQDAIGLVIARDFGAPEGIFHGRITAVDTEGRRAYYHATYDDGDEEDFDYDELKYAVELQQTIALGNYTPVQVNESKPSDGEGIVHNPFEAKFNARMKHTSDSVLQEFSAETEYGQSFRALESSDQKLELVRLNKGAVKGTKEAIKTKLITTKYKQVCADKMREFLIEQRPSLSSTMFRAALPSRPLLLMSPTFMSVGEWVEVDADRTPGWNSEGGVGVIIEVHDTLADVKYVIVYFRNISKTKLNILTLLHMYGLSKVCFDSLG